MSFPPTPLLCAVSSAAVPPARVLVHRVETDETGAEVAVIGKDLTNMQVAATLAHKWVYDYSPPQPGASGVCKTPGPDAIEVNGFPLVVQGFQTQVQVL